ncbi:MAG: PASTA domain-containing protein [Bacteroidota bacterium]|nr:PASTA domain-containing protein [Bacteroidota bacterium]
MEFIKFLISRMFLKNFLIAFAIVIALIFGSLWGLKIYTLHGHSFPVPNFQFCSISSADSICQQKKIRYQIIDSVFVHDLPAGIIIDQIPDSGLMVKENRTIYFTINALEAEKVNMPDLIDLSFRKAKSILENLGLEIGRISYEPDLAVNIVLRQLNNNEEAPPDSLISKGSVIDLVLGQGLSEEKTLLPNLISLELDSARSFASNAYLNIGVVFYDESVENKEDSISAKVFAQKPESNDKNTIKLGSSIDIWLTTDSTKIQSDTIIFDLSDSLKNNTTL